MIFSLTGTNTKKKPHVINSLLFSEDAFMLTLVISLFLKNKNAVIVRQSFVHSYMYANFLVKYILLRFEFS